MCVLCGAALRRKLLSLPQWVAAFVGFVLLRLFQCQLPAPLCVVLFVLLGDLGPKGVPRVVCSVFAFMSTAGGWPRVFSILYRSCSDDCASTVFDRVAVSGRVSLINGFIAASVRFLYAPSRASTRDHYASLLLASARSPRRSPFSRIYESLCSPRPVCCIPISAVVQSPIIARDRGGVSCRSLQSCWVAPRKAVSPLRSHLFALVVASALCPARLCFGSFPLCRVGLASLRRCHPLRTKRQTSGTAYMMPLYRLLVSIDLSDRIGLPMAHAFVYGL